MRRLFFALICVVAYVQVNAQKDTAYFMQQFKKGNEWHNSGKIDSAIKFYKNANEWIKTNPTFDSSILTTKLWSEMGRCYRLLDDVAASHHILSKALQNARTYHHTEAKALIFARLTALHEYIAQKNKAFNYPQVRETETSIVYFPIQQINPYSADSLELIIAAGKLDGIVNNFKYNTVESRYIDGDTLYHKSVHTILSAPLFKIEDNRSIIHVSKAFADKILVNDFYACQAEIPVKWRQLKLKTFLTDNYVFTDGTNELYSYRYYYYYGDTLTEKETLLAFETSAKAAARVVAPDTLTNNIRAAKNEAGIFAGQNMFGAILNSQAIHHQLFLAYKKTTPGTYMGNNPNYNVEFARWVASASPLAPNSIKPYLIACNDRQIIRQQAIQLSEQIIKEELIENWLGIGLQQVLDENTSEAIYTAVLIQDVTTALHDTANYGWADYLWATIHQKTEMMDKAFENLAAAEQYFTRYNNIEGLAWVKTSKEKWEKPIETIVNIQSGHSRHFIVAQAPNGKYFATGGSDRLIKIWDKISGKEIHTLNYHNGAITSLHYSTNGKYLVSASTDRTVTVWNTYNYTPVAGFTTESPSYVAKFSPNSKLLYVSEDSILNIIQPFKDSFTLIQKITLHHNTINDFEFYNNDQNIIYSCSDDGDVLKWNLKDSIIERNWTGFYKVKDITLSSDARFLTVISVDSSLSIYDLTNKDFGIGVKVYLEANEYTNAFPLRYAVHSFSANNQLLVYPVSKDSLEVLNLMDFYARKYKIMSQNQSIRQCLFSPDANDILVINDGLSIKVLNTRNYDFNNNYKLDGPSIKFFSNEIFQVQYYDNDNVLFFLQKERYMGWLNLKDGSMKKKLFKEIDYTLESKNIILTGDSLMAIKFVDYTSVVAVYNINGDVSIRSTIMLQDNESVKAFEPTTDNKTCFVSGKNGRLVKWDIATDKQLFSTQIPTDTSDYSMTMHYDKHKSRLFVVASKNAIYVINPITGNITDTLDIQYSKHINTSSKYIFVTTENGQLKQIPSDTLSQIYYRKINAYNAQCGNLIVTPDEKLIIVQNTLNSLLAINIISDSVLYFVPDHNFTSWSIALSKSGKEFATAGADGTIHLYETLTGKRKATVHAPFNKDPFIVDDQNHYYANKSTLETITVSHNDNVYQYDQFDVQLNRPDIVFNKLGRSDSTTVKLYQNAYKKRIKKLGIAEKSAGLDVHLPKVKLVNKFNITSYTSAKDYTIDIDCFDSKYLLQSLHVLVNNSPVLGVQGRDLSKVKSKSSKQQVTFNLARGINTVKVYCVNNQGVNSLKETFTINCSDTTQPEGKLYFVGIGIAKYKDSTMNLTYSVKDIRDLAASFASTSKNVIIDTFINSAATKENILRIKQKLQKTTPNDRVIIAVTGHGLLSDSLDFYYATYDVNFNKPEAKGLLYEDLEGILDDVPAQEKIMFIDACHSGAIDKDEMLANKKKNGLFEENGTVDENVKMIASRGNITLKNKKINTTVNTSFELMQTQFSDLSRGNGAVVISAAGGTEFAYESAKWNNGVFTYAIREAIFDKDADNYWEGNGDGRISVKELSSYVYYRVKDLTGNKQKPTVRRENFDFDWTIFE